jgi:hypothetical protein
VRVPHRAGEVQLTALDVHHDRLRTAAGQVVSVGCGDRDVLVDAQDRLGMGHASRLGAGQGVPQRRGVHAGIDEQVVDALVGQDRNELRRSGPHRPVATHTLTAFHPPSDTLRDLHWRNDPG